MSRDAPSNKIYKVIICSSKYSYRGSVKWRTGGYKILQTQPNLHTIMDFSVLLYRKNIYVLGVCMYIYVYIYICIYVYMYVLGIYMFTERGHLEAPAYYSPNHLYLIFILSRNANHENMSSRHLVPNFVDKGKLMNCSGNRRNESE